MWFIGIEVEQETSAPPPKKNPGSAPMAIKTMALQQPWAFICYCLLCCQQHQGKVVSFLSFVLHL